MSLLKDLFAISEAKKEAIKLADVADKKKMITKDRPYEEEPKEPLSNGGNVVIKQTKSGKTAGELAEAFAVKQQRLDELSKKTLGTYTKKSIHDLVDNSVDLTTGSISKASTLGRQPDLKEIDPVKARKLVSRSKGLNRAITKLAKEGVERIDELSNDLLGRYKKGAEKDSKKLDKKGDFVRSDKRFSGIVKATKKQFANDDKKRATKMAKEDVQNITFKEFIQERSMMGPYAKFKHPNGGTIQLMKQMHTGDEDKWEISHETTVMNKKNPRSGFDFHGKTLAKGTEKEMRAKFEEMKKRLTKDGE